MLLWSSVFRGEGSGNEDNFLNSGCCAGPRFQAGKVPPLSPASSCFVRCGTHCFSGHPVFDYTARQTAEKSNVFLECVASSTVLGMFDSGCPPLVERVHLATCGLGGAAIVGREDGASGTPVVASLAGATKPADGRADGGFSGALMVRATLGGAAHTPGAYIAQDCGGEHSSVRARFFASVRWRTLCSSCWMWCRRCCLRLRGALPGASGA